MISFGDTLTVCVSRKRPLLGSVCRTHSATGWECLLEIEAG